MTPHRAYRNLRRALFGLAAVPIVAGAAGLLFGSNAIPLAGEPTASVAPNPRIRGSLRTAEAPRASSRSSRPSAGLRPRRSRPHRSRDARPVRWTASLSSRSVEREAAGHTTGTDSCSRHTRVGRRGGHEQRRARSPSVISARPAASPYVGPLVPGAACSRWGRTEVSCPDNAFSYVKNRSLSELLAAREVRHLRTEPYRPQTNGKVERFHQTMGRECGSEGSHASAGRSVAAQQKQARDAPQSCPCRLRSRGHLGHPSGGQRPGQRLARGKSVAGL